VVTVYQLPVVFTTMPLFNGWIENCIFTDAKVLRDLYFYYVKAGHR
jgi:hypothetical protein